MTPTLHRKWREVWGRRHVDNTSYKAVGVRVAWQLGQQWRSGPHAKPLCRGRPPRRTVPYCGMAPQSLYSTIR
ncbi:hypothetical protein J6590_051669 [Homalodisca vitripennis]|nr:hypothetical protein J6590_051669 [Homalodisca vitripennis]